MSKHPKKVSNSGNKKTPSQQQKSSNQQANTNKSLLETLLPSLTKPPVVNNKKISLDKKITDLTISKTQPIANKSANPVLNEKLNELKSKLKKSFSINFVESICYFIESENKRQSEIESSLETIQWPKLEHFLQTLKKMCKQKQHLLLLFQKLQVSSAAPSTSTNVPSLSTGTATKKIKNTKAFTLKNDSREELDKEVDDFANPKEENFSLVKIIIRFLFKLFKISCYGETKRKETVNDQNKFLNLQLVLLSCLADICFYEELRIQVINDVNLQCLFKIFILTTNLELDDTPSISTSDADTDRFKNVKKYWSKMCRLSANLCQDKNSMKMKNLFTRDFISGLCSCMEKQSQLLQSQLNLNNCDSNANDLDLYHSLIRLIKYSYQVKKCKDLILETRLLVYISRTMFKYNKNLTLLVDGSSKPAPIEPVLASNETPTPIQTIYINKKSQLLCKELVRHYLNMLESWPQPICNEFYNQIIEGSTIEHLLWLHIDDPSEQKSITSMQIDQCKKSENEPQSSTKQEPSKTVFNYSEFSFNLLLKFCHEYHVCRAEFGRVGGLNKYLTKIEAINSQITTKKDSANNLSKETLRTYGKLIEMICFNCKESVNRLRLKEQGHLSKLVKHQQDLKAEKLKAILKQYNEKSLQELCSDSSIHNKLLVAMCCFAHDQDSMNILLSNGLVDALLGFLNDSIMYENKNSTINNQDVVKEKPDYSFAKYGSCLLKQKESKPVFLSNLLMHQEGNISTENSLNCKKRKASDPLQTLSSISTPSTSHALKRSKLTQITPTGSGQLQQPVFAHPAGLIDSNSNNLNFDFDQQFQLNQVQQAQNPQPTSPDSYCSLSPTSNPFSPAFSPSSPTIYRSNSTVMCSNAFNNSSSNLYSSFSPSPSYNDMSSPKFNWQNNEDQSFNIQFSPTIERIDSDDEVSNETKIEANNILKEEYDDIMIIDANNCQAPDEIDLTVDDKTDTLHDQIKFNLDSSNCTDEQTDSEAKLAALLCTSKNSEETQNIESIHRTEACVFYVLSQLSHGDKPSIFLFNNFESITTCLLNYLKNAKVRNPRALRILNRLTKNHYCFYNLVSTQFPYKIKSLFFKHSIGKLKSSEDSKSFKTRKITTSSSCTDLEKLKPNSSLTSSKSMLCFNEQDIEKEMNIYLNSNKVFFDAHTFFPSFESIEFTLLNNLKMQCISSSDHGYLSLVSMMKATHKKSERLSCAFVAPFILRNSKALQNIMVNLNGIDLIIDQISPNSIYDTDETNLKSSTQLTDSEMYLQQNAILCIRKILRFVSYKYDTKRLKENFENCRNKITQKFPSDTKETTGSNNQVKFLFNEKTQANKFIEINSEKLASQSEYFNALLHGGFSEGNQQNLVIPITDISFEVFSIIMSMIMHGSNTDHEINLSTCIELILAADKLFLTEIKDFFISVLLDRFLDMSTCFICFRLAWYLDSKLLEKETIEYFLSRFYEINDKVSKSMCQKDESTKGLEYESLDDAAKCAVLIDYAIESFKQNSGSSLINEKRLQIIETNSIQERQLIEHFKKNLKDALTQIIHK